MAKARAIVEHIPVSQPNHRPAEAGRNLPFVADPRTENTPDNSLDPSAVANIQLDHSASRFGGAASGPPSPFAHLAVGKSRHLSKRADLLREGDTVDHLYVLTQGWACRYKSASDGARQIIGFLIPGDLCNPEHLYGGSSSYAVAGITKINVAMYAFDKVQMEMARCPAISRALWSEAASLSNRERNWLLTIGRRDAIICVAHLLCELSERLGRVGLVDEGSFLFPVTQYDIAAATGISAVHANRTMALLRQRGLITTKRHNLTIVDVARLQQICLFEPLR